MANQLFPAGREGFLDGSIDWDTATIKVSLLRGYTYDSTDRFVSDVLAAGGVLVSTVTLAGKSALAGVADAADVIFPAVPPGAAIPHMLIAQTSAPSGGGDLAATSQRLVALIDDAENLPVIPNGGDVNNVWGDGPDKIFRL